MSNIASTPEALKAYLKKDYIEIFERLGILTEREFHARYEIELENYIKKIQIESRVIGDLAMNHVVSTAVKYQSQLVLTARALKEMELTKEAEPIIKIIREISERVTEISLKVDEMTEARKKANNVDDIEEKARLYATDVKHFFEEIRYNVDKLEILIDDEDWPLVKYRELLYIR